MIYIDGILLNASMMQIIRELKMQLMINNIFLFGTIKDSNEDIMVSCPIHKNGQEKRPSCGINKQTGVCHCFTCGYAVRLTEMISNVFEYNDYGIYGREWLKKNFSTVSVHERNDVSLDLSRDKKDNDCFMTDEEYEKYNKWIHHYVYERGLTDEIIERYDIGFDAETDSIVFPCRDISGNIQYLIRRSVETKWFNYTGGSKKLVYGIYEFIKYFPNATELYICESIFNALSLVACGIPAVALNGTGSKEQYESLAKLSVRSLVMALDPDDAGKKGTERLAKKLKEHKILYTIDYKDTRDINDLYLSGELNSVLSTKHLYFS